MRTLSLFICFLLFSTISFANKKNQISFQIIDAYDNKVVENCLVTIYNYSKNIIATKISDSLGIASFTDIHEKYIIIKTSAKENLYLSFDNLFNSKKLKGKTKPIFLYPNDLYEEEILAFEDSLYGKVPIDVFDETEEMEIDTSAANSNFHDAIFPGGIPAFIQFMTKNVIYPPRCVEKGIQGKVVLFFTVEKNGKISHLNIMKSVVTEIDAEAKRLVRAMPPWIPAKIDDQEVRRRCKFPLKFSL